MTAPAADVPTVQQEEEEDGDDADQDGDQERGQEVPGVRLGIQLRDGEAGVGPGVVAGHAGVRGGGLVVPGVAHHGGGVAAGPDVDLEDRDPRGGGGGLGELGRG